MKKTLFALLTVMGFSMFIAAASAGPMLQFRSAAETPSDGAEKISSVTHRNGETVTQVWYVQKEVLLDESMLKSAKAGRDGMGHDIINLTFNDSGAKKLAVVTRENLHKTLALLIDGKVCTAPTIQSEISGGTAVITGDFSKAEVADMVKKLNEAVKK
jgi:preprotein translocase subunit SecD